MINLNSSVVNVFPSRTHRLSTAMSGGEPSSVQSSVDTVSIGGECTQANLTYSPWQSNGGSWLERVGTQVKRIHDQQTGKEILTDMTEAAGGALGRRIGEARGRRIFPILMPTIGGMIGHAKGAAFGRKVGQFIGDTPVGRIVGGAYNKIEGGERHYAPDPRRFWG